MKFLNAHYLGRCASFNEWRNAKKFKHLLVKHNLWEHYIAYMNNHCVFSSPAVDNGAIFHLQGMASTLFNKHEHLFPLILHAAAAQRRPWWQ